MKKIKNVLLLIVIMISLTGCVKFNASMNIKKDKSMDFEIIYAFNSSLVGDSEVLSSEDKQKMIDQGFDVTDYADDTMKGFKLVKTIKNIDDVSTTNATNYSLSGVVGESEDSYIFEVKKGFLKNTYTAKLNFDANDSGLNEDMGDLTGEDDGDIYYPSDDEVQVEIGENDITVDTDTDTDTNVNPDENTDTDTNSDMDFGDLEEMLATMDLSFNVNLPYKAIRSNATSTDNNNRNLSWKLTTDQVSTIDFVFELYNMNNIMYIGIVVLIIIVVVIVIFMKKGKKNKENDIPTVNEAPITQAENQNVTPIAPTTPADAVSPVTPAPVPTPTPAPAPTISPVTPVGPAATPVVNNPEPAKPVAPVSPATPQITPVQPINPAVPPVVPIQVVSSVNQVNPAPVPQEPASPSPAPNPAPAPTTEIPIINHTSLSAEPTIENLTPSPETLSAPAPTSVVPTPTAPPVMDSNPQPNNNNPM